MLTPDEREKRIAFYGTKFGIDRVCSSFRTTLWPVAAYTEKMEWLARRGFADPHALILSYPAILGHSLKSIDRKLRLAKRLHANIHDFLACNTPVFAGLAHRHYVPILRMCRALSLEPTPRNFLHVFAHRKED